MLSKPGADRGRLDSGPTYVFDVGARQDSDHVAVLDTKVVADDPIDAGTAVIELFVLQDDEYGVLSLLAANQNCVASE